MVEVEKGIQTHSPLDPEGQAIMEQKKLTLKELSYALAVFQESAYELKVFLGIDEKGFYGSEDWMEADGPITFIPWVQIYEILGMVEAGSTEEFMEGGTEYN